MGGRMGEGGDFQRTGWMVGSEKRDIHWVNDPRNLSNFVLNFQFSIFRFFPQFSTLLKSFELSWNTLDYKVWFRNKIHCV